MIKGLSEKEYNTLLYIVIPKLKDYPHIDATDIVADTVLKASELDELIYFHDIKKMVVSVTLATIHQTFSVENLGGRLNNVKISKSEHVKVCCMCKEPHPIGNFNIVNRKINGDAFNCQTEVLSYCKECQRKKAKEQTQRNKGNDVKSQSRRKANRKYQEKKRKNRSLAEKRKYKEYMKDYYKKRQNRSKSNNPELG